MDKGSPEAGGTLLLVVIHAGVLEHLPGPGLFAQGGGDLAWPHPERHRRLEENGSGSVSPAPPTLQQLVTLKFWLGCTQWCIYFVFAISGLQEMLLWCGSELSLYWKMVLFTSFQFIEKHGTNYRSSLCKCIHVASKSEDIMYAPMGTRNHKCHQLVCLPWRCAYENEYTDCWSD